jgi:hydroxypyruvate isomerase
MATRRDAMKTLAGSGLLATAPMTLAAALGASENQLDSMTKGRIHHSVCRWCFNDVSLDKLCQEGKAMGLEAIDLIAPADFDTVKKNGLTVSMVSPDGLPNYIGVGWNHKENHASIIPFYKDLIEKTAAAGFKNIICFSGNRKGIDEELGLINCAQGLQQILPLAESKGINIIMELLNSKVDHADYQCDNSKWGVELVKTVGSDRFSLLYDIYHMQIMEGDVIRTIKANAAYYGHYHTAGVPGRHEIDDNQELYYPAIMRTIADTGFKGYVAQEFIASAPDKLASLRDAVKRCDI